jgi:hypothetical protein
VLSGTDQSEAVPLQSIGFFSGSLIASDSSEVS